MNVIGTFFRALWRGLEGLRKFLHLILLLIIFGFIFGALRVSLPHVPQSAVLVVKPEGDIVEQLTGDPIERAIQEARGLGRAETLLWDLVDSIRGATKDNRIRAILLDLDYLGSAGQPALEEVAVALGEFRASGKKVIAFGSSYLQDHYYLAAHADEIYVDPLGFVLIDGYERFRFYLKEAFDKIAVRMNVFRVGEYKSAVETFTRTNMSPEDREESLVYLNSLWASYQKAATSARKLQGDALAKYVANMSDAMKQARGHAAQVALDAGLITGIKSRQDVEARLIELVGEDATTGSFYAVTDREYIRVVQAEKALRPDGIPRIGVIVASGEIVDGEQPPGTIGGDSTARLIRDARLDDRVHAVVLRVDSPGGSVMASEQIYRELLALKKAGKPVVVSMGTLAASGGYYISAPADEIWASPATLTGSIGIFAVVPTIDGLLNKFGVTVDGVGTTPLSGQLRIDRPLGEDARVLLQTTIEHGYEEFLARVAAGRNKTRDEVDAIAQGRVWAGTDAKRLGLVDELGTFDDAVKAAAKRANLTEYHVDFVKPKLSWAQELALQVKMMAVRAVLGGKRPESPVAQLARHIDPLQREIERLNRFSIPNRLYAYCFCAAP